MKELTENKIQEILQGNAESLNTEFKSSFNFNVNTWMKDVLIRSILAMSNTRNGGYIVIGIQENKDKSFNFTGVEKEHLISFRGDILKAKVESFSSSPVDYEIGVGSLKGKKFIVISIVEFSLNPCVWVLNQNG